jgi:hypothetical protein
MEDLMKEMEEEKIKTTPAKIVTTPEGIEITPEGGEYTLLNGIIIIAPEGAVTTKTKIDVRLIDKSNKKIIAFYESREESIDNYYICVDAKPDGLSFKKPISIVLPADIYPGAIPSVYEVDLSTYSYSRIPSKIVINPIKSNVTLSLDHFSLTLLELTEKMKREGERWCRANPLRCKCLVDILQKLSEKTRCGGITDCQYSSINIEQTFYEGPCKDLITHETDEQWIYTEECEPVLKLVADNTTIPTKGKTTIRANINICRGLENQPVKFEVLDLTLGSINPINFSTDTDGNAVTTFKAKDKEGKVTITANATVSWYLENFKVNGIWQQNLADTLKTKLVSDSIDITITDKWTGTIDYRFKLDNDPDNPRIDAFWKVEFEFAVAKEEDPIIGGRPINGTATATQQISMLPPADLASVVVHAPKILNDLFIMGYVDEYVHFFVWPEISFYTFDSVDINGDILAKDLPGLPHALHIGKLPTIMIMGNNKYNPTNSVPLKKGIYKVEPRSIEGEKIIYTITLK